MARDETNGSTCSKSAQEKSTTPCQRLSQWNTTDGSTVVAVRPARMPPNLQCLWKCAAMYASVHTQEAICLRKSVPPSSSVNGKSLWAESRCRHSIFRMIPRRSSLFLGSETPFAAMKECTFQAIWEESFLFHVRRWWATGTARAAAAAANGEDPQTVTQLLTQIRDELARSNNNSSVQYPPPTAPMATVLPTESVEN